MDLNIVWFILIAVLFVGFFFLEGFDYGVGILLPFISKDDKTRRVIINSIGSTWDGNEVWMLTAGGALFASFPNWYATLFSGFYIALFLMLVALIVRATAFEYRSKKDDPVWRNRWDWVIFFGSFIPALLWGVAFANIIRGVPIDAHMNYIGGFFNLLNPYALLGGLASLSVFMLHGAIFLNLKTTDDLREKTRALAQKLWLPAVALLLLFMVFSSFATDMFAGSAVTMIVAGLAAISIIAVFFMLKADRGGWAFVATALTIVFSVVTIFLGLFPRVMVARIDGILVPANDLTIYNASASPYTLQVMSIVALIFVPIVLAYQGWTYWVFRQRLSTTSELEY